MCPPSLAAGAITPIGLHGSWPCRDMRTTFGFFISAIDVGAITAYQFGSSESLPNFNFWNVFSPGIFFTLGIFKSPITFLVGCSLAPSLSSIVDGQAVVNNGSRLRASLGLTVDVPFLFIYRGESCIEAYRAEKNRGFFRSIR